MSLIGDSSTPEKGSGWRNSGVDCSNFIGTLCLLYDKFPQEVREDFMIIIGHVSGACESIEKQSMLQDRRSGSYIGPLTVGTPEKWENVNASGLRQY